MVESVMVESSMVESPMIESVVEESVVVESEISESATMETMEPRGLISIGCSCDCITVVTWIRHYMQQVPELRAFTM